MASVVWAPRALKDLEAIEPRRAKNIVEAVVRFAETGVGNVKALRGDAAQFRLRVGDYRVLFDREGLLVLSVVRVGHRREIYR